MEKLSFRTLQAVYLLNTEYRKLKEEDYVSAYSCQWHLKAQYDPASKTYTFDLDRKDVKIDRKKAEKLMNRIMLEIGNSLYPLRLEVTPQLQINKIINYDEIEGRWREATQKCRDEHPGDIMERYIEHSSGSFSSQRALLRSFYRDSFINLYFRNLYALPQSPDERERMEWQNFPLSEMKSCYFCTIEGPEQNRRKLEGPLGVHCGSQEIWTAVYQKNLPDTKVPVYFIDHEQSFGRDGIYGTPTETDFADNPQRFSILCHAAFQLCRKLDWYPDIIHGHDWATALAPILLKFSERRDKFAKAASVLTIHNLGYQGIYSKQNYSSTGLDWNCFDTAGFEDWDRMNFLKAGLVSSDMLTTVSATYAEEIQRPEYGFRMDGILRYRNQDLFGILNGFPD